MIAAAVRLWLTPQTVALITALGLTSPVMAEGSARRAFPAPDEKNQVFFVQRSMNANTIVYVARLNGTGRLDGRRPIDVYWRRFNDDGERMELSFLERNAAFGVKTIEISQTPQRFSVHVVSYPDRKAMLSVVNGRPQLEGKIAGEPARLISAYLHLDETGSMPRVVRVDLLGQSLATGAEIEESFIP